jgi:hypothetical protein
VNQPTNQNLQILQRLCPKRETTTQPKPPINTKFKRFSLFKTSTQIQSGTTPLNGGNEAYNGA